MPNTNDAQAAFRLLLTPDRAVVAAGQATTLKVLARIQAPQSPADAPPRREGQEQTWPVRRTWTRS